MKTDELISLLAGKSPAVRRLRHPVIRAGLWVGFSLVVIGILAVNHGLRAGFPERFRDATYSLGIVCAFVTGIAAAISAFLVSVPDRSDLWVILPLPSLFIWLSNIGYQCFGHWVDVPAGAITAGGLASCGSTVILISVPLSLLMLQMLRASAPQKLLIVAFTASLAISAMTCLALSTFHPLDATVMVLGWNLGTTAAFVGVALLLGRIFARRRVIGLGGS